MGVLTRYVMGYGGYHLQRITGRNSGSLCRSRATFSLNASEIIQLGLAQRPLHNWDEEDSSREPGQKTWGKRNFSFNWSRVSCQPIWEPASEGQIPCEDICEQWKVTKKTINFGPVRQNFPLQFSCFVIPIYTSHVVPPSFYDEVFSHRCSTVKKHKNEVAGKGFGKQKTLFPLPSICDRGGYVPLPSGSGLLTISYSSLNFCHVPSTFSRTHHQSNWTNFGYFPREYHQRLFFCHFGLGLRGRGCWKPAPSRKSQWK